MCSSCFRRISSIPAVRNQVGLYFKLDPGWHVYWKNPGDAGEPPHIHWTLPAGVTASAFEFPAPKRLPLGPLMDFGYEDEVLYPLTFTVAATVKSGPAVIDARWTGWSAAMSAFPARPSSRQLQLSLQRNHRSSIGAGSDAELIRRFAATLPVPLPAGDKALFEPTQQGFRLGVVTGHRESTAAFFPADQNILSNPAPQQARPRPTALCSNSRRTRASPPIPRS